MNRGRDKEELARSLGAHDYIDSEAGDVAEALQLKGGARAIIATVTNANAMRAIVGGLGANGMMMVIGLPIISSAVLPIHSNRVLFTCATRPFVCRVT